MPSEISRQQIFEKWISFNQNESFDRILDWILGNISLGSQDNINIDKLKAFLRTLLYKMANKWKKYNRHISKFSSKEKAWLEQKINLNEFLETRSNFKKVGRPTKSFDQCSDKVKLKKAKELSGLVGHEAIYLAAQLQMNAAGKRNSANIVKELAFASPQRGSILKKARLSNECSSMLTPENAVALIIDTNLSTHQYRKMREYSISNNIKMYPCYSNVYSAKLACYPKDIRITETVAEIKLQSLIDHTVTRLWQAEQEFMNFNTNMVDLNIIFKWGCDGSRQKQYKQSFSEQNVCDNNLFAISLVPIQIYNISATKEKQILWQNPATSSTKYCRPIKLIYSKESTEIIRQEVESVKLAISKLIPTKIEINNSFIKIKSNLILCMVDGKVCCALSNYKSTQTCYLCGATPKMMNDPVSFKNNFTDDSMLSLGLSVLHAHIRLMECLLHIAYRIDIKSWQVNAQNKEKANARKSYIQDRFKKETGLLIDFPSPNGGNTNDGNTARRFFKDAEKSADITGIDINVIIRFRTILQAISCGLQINLTSFQNYCSETAKLYLELYPWYYMPVTLHKILYHGSEIIKSCILPIGQLSEEAQEATNKIIRRYRELFTRKTSRIDTNTDLIKRSVKT